MKKCPSEIKNAAKKFGGKKRGLRSRLENREKSYPNWQRLW